MGETARFSLMELFRMGGPFMWPLFFFSAALTAIILERLIYFLRSGPRFGVIKEKAGEFIRAGELSGAEDYLSGLARRRMGARIFLAIVKSPELDEQRMERAAEAEARSCINSLEEGLSFLTALGSIAQLTGFLGTVSGMIGAFKSIAEAEELSAQTAASGVYEALITTVFGLIIAIAAMIAHSLFSHVVDKFAADAEKSCAELISGLAAEKGRAKTAPAFQERPE
ncbi:MAG: MotA/TolQ/ExbB proton channel family protein [Treponema sp.]|jgi:biopolymer transport protein ExbB|nr:MotA/TolQ/ExbB proton channel family protein [Treponema sp.]